MKIKPHKKVNKVIWAIKREYLYKIKFFKIFNTKWNSNDNIKHIVEPRFSLYRAFIFPVFSKKDNFSLLTENNNAKDVFKKAINIPDKVSVLLSKIVTILPKFKLILIQRK